MHLCVQDIQKLFSNAYFRRGQAYAQDGRVEWLEVLHDTPDKLVLEAEVYGTRLYAQKVIVKPQRNKLTIKGYCTCPLDYNCKHVVAALLMYIQEYGDNLQHQYQEGIEHWLHDFASIQAEQPQQRAPQDDNFIAYVLQPVSSLYMDLACIGTRVSKRGGLTKGHEFDLSMLMNRWSSPTYLTHEDEKIIGLLGSVDDSQAAISGEAGYLALKQMVKTGRCFWQSHQSHKPLQFAAPRPCKQFWHKDEAGGLSFVLTVSPDAYVLPTTPLMYVDAKQGVVGQVADCALTGEQLLMLRRAPKVPEHEAEAFSQALVQVCPPSVLVPPKAVEVCELGDVQPKPTLKVNRLNTGKLVACLHMLYDGYAISPTERSSWVAVQAAGKVVYITRHRDAEQAWIDQLLQLGMQQDTQQTSEMCFTFAAANAMARWLAFFEGEIPRLQDQGWQIAIEDGLTFEVQQVDQWFVGIEAQQNGWFDLRFDVEIGGTKHALLPLLAHILDYETIDDVPDPVLLDLGNQKFVRIPKQDIEPVLQTIDELYGFQSMDSESISLPYHDIAALSHLPEPERHFIWQDAQHLRQTAQKLRDFTAITHVNPPQSLKASLHPYQQQGLNWLQFLREYHFHGILADDMGLGKTIQTLAHIALEKESGRMQKPCLIVVPTSLVSNWKREAAHFVPDLKVLPLQGEVRAEYFAEIASHDVVITTYPLLRFDSEVLLAHEYHMLILDEAQVVKNANTKSAKIVRQLQATHRLCLTGTPLENHLGELWAQFDFLMPGFLGDQKTFHQVFRKPIEKDGDQALQQRLYQRIKPFMLRRTKDQVAKELPEKVEIVRSVALGEAQALLYESIRVTMEKKVRDMIASKGLARSHITILDALLKLRQVCCDPRLLSLQQAKKIEESAKLELLMQMLPEMIAEGRRVLLFSQFTTMLSLIEKELKASRIAYSKLTGRTKNRDAAIEAFKQGKANVFLISLKAGGVGLNLTEADTVIHYDPWWNPAVENQAADRAHRMGQDKTVFVYKLVVENSVEEKILAMQVRKKELADAVYAQGADQTQALTAEDMQALFSPLQSE